MVDLVAFVLLVLVIVGAPLVWLLLRSAPQPGTKQMVLLGGAAGEAELTSWASALRNAGIHPRVLNVGGTGYGPPPIMRSGCRRGMRIGRVRCWACSKPAAILTEPSLL